MGVGAIKKLMTDADKANKVYNKAADSYLDSITSLIRGVLDATGKDKLEFQQPTSTSVIVDDVINDTSMVADAVRIDEFGTLDFLCDGEWWNWYDDISISLPDLHNAVGIIAEHLFDNKEN